MLVGGVVNHEIQDDADAVLLPQLLQLIEVSQRSISLVDILVVGDVVAEVNLWRWEARRDPDRIHAEGMQVVQLRGDAVQVAVAVAVAVHETAWVDFVEHCVLPPLVPFCVNRFGLSITAGQSEEESHQHSEQWCVSMHRTSLPGMPSQKRV